MFFYILYVCYRSYGTVIYESYRVLYVYFVEYRDVFDVLRGFWKAKEIIQHTQYSVFVTVLWLLCLNDPGCMLANHKVLERPLILDRSHDTV